jgi:hypothetical protein
MVDKSIKVKERLKKSDRHKKAKLKTWLRKYV